MGGSLEAAAAAALLELAGQGCADPVELARRLLLPPRRVLQLLEGLPGIEPGPGGVCVTEPVELALYAIRLGASPSLVARGLDWRMFEEYAARALSEAGFEVRRGLRRHGRGGFQVDVLGYTLLRGRVKAVAIECKHWSPRSSSPSRLREAAERHLERTRRLASSWRLLGLPGRGGYVLPAVLVLREQGVPRVAAGVPIVPVARLRGFLEELDEIIYSGDFAVVEVPEG